MLAAVAGEVAEWRSIIVRLAPIKRERSKVEMPARSANVEHVEEREERDEQRGPGDG